MKLEQSVRLFMLLLVALILTLTGCSSSDSDDEGDSGPANEGSVSEPVALTIGTAGSCTVATNSYYTFTTTKSGSYAAGVTSVTGAGIGIDLNTDSGFTTGHTPDSSGACSVGADCTINLNNLDASTTYYLQVSSVAPGATFTLTLGDGVGQGSENDPEPLTLGTALSGELELNQASYYEITTSTAGGYEFETSGLTGTNHVYLHEKSTYVAGQAMETNAIAFYTDTGCNVTNDIDKYCVVALKSATEYLVSLTAGGETPARDEGFTITASRGQGDGADGDPVALTLNLTTNSALYTGGWHSYKNYFSFTDNDSPYTFQIMDDDYLANMQIQILNTAGTEVSTCTNNSVVGFSCVLAGDNSGSTYTLVLTNLSTTSFAGDFEAFSFELQ